MDILAGYGAGAFGAGAFGAVRSNRNLDNERGVELAERDYSAYGGIFIGSAGSSYPGKRAGKEMEKREDAEMERMEKDYVDILFG